MEKRTIKHLRQIYGNQYHQIAEVVITNPEYLLPISSTIVKDSLATFDGYDGPKTAQLMSYGDAWRFWVVQESEAN